MAQSNAPMTSELIAKMLHTNPAVVRRTMAGLRNAGYVNSEKGHGGGWTLSKSLSEITLLDVYKALGNPELFSFGFSDENPKCLVEHFVNNSLKQSIEEAEKALLNSFGQLKLDSILQEFEKKNCTISQYHDLNIN